VVFGKERDRVPRIAGPECAILRSSNWQ